MKKTFSILVILSLFISSTQSQTLDRKILFFDDDDVLYRSGTKPVLNQLRRYDADSTTPDTVDAVLKPGGWATTAKSLITLCSVSWEKTRTPRYMMWYQVDTTASGFTGADKIYDNVVAYAESADGITWTKPNLRAITGFSFPNAAGATDNNIVLVGVGSAIGKRTGCSVIYDPTATDPNRRYKMAFADWANPNDASQGLGLQVAFSPDGVRWTKYQAPGGLLQKMAYNHRNAIPPPAGQTAYSTVSTGPRWALPLTLSEVVNAFYDQPQNKYVIYGRMPIEGPTGAMNWKNGLGRIESNDFISWSLPELILAPNDSDIKNTDSDPLNDFDVSFQDSPVLYYDGIYLSLNQLLDSDTGLAEIELMSSRDGKHWKRFKSADYNNAKVLPLGAVIDGVAQDFDSRRIYTNSSLVVGDNFRFYYGGTGNKSGIGFADIKRDRIVGLKANWIWVKNKPLQKIEPTGQVTLRPFHMDGISTMKINATIESGGSVKVEILDPLHYRVAGFTQTDCSTLTAPNIIDGEVKWGNSTLASLPAGEYLVRIHLYKSTLYNCKFYKN